MFLARCTRSAGEKKERMTESSSTIGIDIEDLHEAVENGDIATVEQALRNGASANSVVGTWPLLCVAASVRFAAQFSYFGYVFELKPIEERAKSCCGAVVDARSGCGRADTHRRLPAADAGRIGALMSNIVEFADTKATARLCRRHCAADRARRRRESQGKTSDHNCAARSGIGAYLVQTRKRGAIAHRSERQSGHTEVVAILIKHGANVDTRDECGSTPLWKAAEVNWPMRSLVASLIHAQWCQNGQKDVCAVLLESGVADINARDNFDGMTPLYVAAWVRFAFRLYTKTGRLKSDLQARAQRRCCVST